VNNYKPQKPLKREITKSRLRGYYSNTLKGGRLIMAKKNAGDDHIIACLSYLGILFLIPLLAKKDSKFCMFHAKQGLALFIVSIIISFLGMIPLLGWFIILPLGMLFVLILAIWGIVAALQGKETKLPLIGSLAEKFDL
jgi:uncharacterized membrane protein